MRKIFATISAIALVVALAIPAMAGLATSFADGVTTVTLTDNANKVLYQDTFSGSVRASSTTSNGITTVTVNGKVVWSNYVTINFTGVEGVTVRYWTTVWGNVTGTFNNSAKFEIPEGAKSFQVIKGGMFYDITWEDGVFEYNVPVITLRAFGYQSDCNIRPAQVGGSWVYDSAAMAGDVQYTCTVFDNGRDYNVQLYREGFHPITATAEKNWNDEVEEELWADFDCFYYWDVPEGVSNVWIASYPYSWNTKDANEGDQLVLVVDYNDVKMAQMRFVVDGTTYNVEFPLDGTNPFTGMFIVNFPGVEGVTMQYYVNGAWGTVDGTFDNFAIFNAPGATSVRAVKAGMYYQFDNLTGAAYPCGLDVPVINVRVFGIAADCRIGVSQGSWVYDYENVAGGYQYLYTVFDNGRNYSVKLASTGYFPVEATAVRTNDNGIDELWAYFDVFYNIPVPDGVTNIKVSNANWVDTTVWHYNWIDQDVFTLMANYTAAKLYFNYDGVPYEIDFTLDGSNPFDLFDFDDDECDHFWDDCVVTIEPTDTEEGAMTCTCTICGETCTKPIPALNYNWVVDVSASYFTDNDGNGWLFVWLSDTADEFDEEPFAYYEVNDPSDFFVTFGLWTVWIDEYGARFSYDE